MNSMELVAFDLDNTLLDTDKHVSQENIDALLTAEWQGVKIVVSTGRFYMGIPEPVRKFCRYFITMNGAKVFDCVTGDIIYEATIPPEEAVRVYNYADTLDCVYDAYLSDTGFMTKTQRDVLMDYVFDKNYAVTMLEQREPVPDIKSFVLDNNYQVQKIQFFFKDLALRDKQFDILPTLFDDLKYSFSLGSNLEINSAGADKGIALKAVCDYLGVDISQSVAFGDGLNDMAMIAAAGTGYCMINGDDRLKAIADAVTEYDCNNSGVGREVLKLLSK